MVTPDSSCPGCTGALPPQSNCQRCLPRQGALRTLAIAVAWFVAGAMFIGGIIAVYHTLTFPSALAAHPVRAYATVTDQFIDGFGGDPSVDYRYAVHGQTYIGYGTGELGGEDPTTLHRGDPILIEYAAAAPSQSCTCNAKGSADRVQLAGFPLLAAPLIMIAWRVRRSRSRSRA
jgi:hypothetical protein